jgi:hypothetical protein
MLVLLFAAPLVSWSQDRTGKSPLDYSLKYYGLMLGVALLGGLVSYWGKLRRGEVPKWAVSHLIGELTTSALAGLLCFWFCEWAGFPPLLTAGFTGVAGHMGTRAITMYEGMMARKFGTASGPVADGLAVPPPDAPRKEQA